MVRSNLDASKSSFTRILALGVLVLSLGVLDTPGAWAQVGRVGITVTDPSGEPLQGVDLRATQDEMGVDMSRTTDKKGKARIAFRHGTQVHLLTLTKEGYRTLEHQFKPGAGSSYLEFTLEPHGSAPAGAEAGAGEAGAGEDGAAGGTGKLTPAQEVFNQGVEALKTGDFATAKQKFNEALELDPSLIVSHLALAGVHFEEGDAEAAKAAAELVLETEPENARALHILYESHKKLGDEKAAESTLERLSKLESGGDAAAIIYNDGASALRLGDTDRAVERLSKALELDPDLHAAMRLLARIYQTQGDHQKALDMADRALALQPGEARVMKVRYESLAALGRQDEAEEARTQLVSQDPTTLINDYAKKGEDAFNGGDTEAAVGYFQQILELDSEHADALYFLGLSYVNLGKNAEAKSHFEKFIAIAADDPRAETAKEMLGFL